MKPRLHPPPREKPSLRRTSGLKEYRGDLSDLLRDKEPIVHSILNPFHSEFKADDVMRNDSFKSDVTARFRGPRPSGAGWRV